MFVRQVYAIIVISYNILLLSKAATVIVLNPKPCPPLKPTISQEDECYVDDVPMECENSTQARITVIKKCRSPYTNNGQPNGSYYCDQLSYWRPSYNPCQADCGMATSSNEFPWIAAIYDESDRFLCDGVIISPYHVVTVATCLFQIGFTWVVNYDDSARINIPTEKLRVIAGKHYINLNRKESSQQNRKVERVHKHKDFLQGRANKGEIMLLEVDKEFEFFDDVRPACIDWELFFEEWDFREDNQGIVAGLGYDQEEVIPCEVSNIRYWQRNVCWENFSNMSRNHFSYDKYCVQYTDGNFTTSKCRGTGIYFKTNQQRYFLNGLVSNADPESKGYALYIKISTYLEWLKDELGKHETINTNFETSGKDIYYSTGACTLPEHIQYGKFSLTTGRTYPGGTKVSTSAVILLSCDDGKTTKYFRCLNNEWSPSIDNALCKKPGSCPSLIPSESEDIFCKLNDSRISCVEPPTDTIAVILCQPYYIFLGQKPVYKCQNGKWDPPFTSCSLECGTKRVDVATLTIGGSETHLNEYPWVTAIYNEDQLVCGGTLISRSYIISAAHCFTDKKGVHNKIDNYTIIAGKYYRNISVEESGSQKRKIKLLHVHEDFKGSIQRYRDDIALIELDEKYTVSLEVQPACIDWESTFEDIDFNIGKMGVVTGWGFTQQGSSPSDVLKKLVVPFQPKDVCLENLPKDFSTQFVATDKICAGYKDKNSNVCRGDSGGGLCFKSDGLHYYLRGVVSLTVPSEIGCDANLFFIVYESLKILTVD